MFLQHSHVCSTTTSFSFKRSSTSFSLSVCLDLVWICNIQCCISNLLWNWDSETVETLNNVGFVLIFIPHFCFQARFASGNLIPFLFVLAPFVFRFHSLPAIRILISHKNSPFFSLDSALSFLLDNNDINLHKTNLFRSYFFKAELKNIINCLSNKQNKMMSLRKKDLLL